MEFPGIDRDEPAVGRRGLAGAIVAPAGDGSVGSHPTGVGRTGADGHERAVGRRGLAEAIVAPAFDCTVDTDTAGVGPAGADGDESVDGQLRRIYGVSPFRGSVVARRCLITAGNKRRHDDRQHN